MSFAAGLLAGKVAVVTGGGTGIGKAVAAALAAHGADVALAARDGKRLEAAAAEISRASGRRALAVPTDVAEPDAVSALFETVEARLGPVGVLVNGAAANFVRPSEMLSAPRLRKVIDIVLHGSVQCALEAGRRMLPRGEGVIVNLLASYAWTGAPGLLASAAAKAGVLAMTRTLGVEWASRGVRVNAVCPGLVDTEQSRERLWPEPWMREALLESVPARRFVEVAEIADAVLFLCAPAARSIAGQVLTVDGGAATGGVPYLRFLEKAGAVRRRRPGS